MKSITYPLPTVPQPTVTMVPGGDPAVTVIYPGTGLPPGSYFRGTASAPVVRMTSPYDLLDTIRRAAANARCNGDSSDHSDLLRDIAAADWLAVEAWAEGK